MSILSGYKKIKDRVLTSTGYQLLSRWTSSNTVEFDDGETAETKVGAISGITDSLTATSSNIALSSAGGNNLQTQIDEVNSNLSTTNGTLSTSYSDNPISYVYNGFMGMIHINSLKNIEKGSWITIGSLPKSVRPSGQRVIDLTCPAGAYVRIRLQSTGNIEVYNYTDNDTKNIIGTFTFMK